MRTRIPTVVVAAATLIPFHRAAAQSQPASAAVALNVELEHGVLPPDVIRKVLLEQEARTSRPDAAGAVVNVSPLECVGVRDLSARRECMSRTSGWGPLGFDPSGQFFAVLQRGFPIPSVYDSTRVSGVIRSARTLQVQSWRPLQPGETVLSASDPELEDLEFDYLAYLARSGFRPARTVGSFMVEGGADRCEEPNLLVLGPPLQGWMVAVVEHRVLLIQPDNRRGYFIASPDGYASIGAVFLGPDGRHLYVTVSVKQCGCWDDCEDEPQDRILARRLPALAS